MRLSTNGKRLAFAFLCLTITCVNVFRSMDSKLFQNVSFDPAAANMPNPNSNNYNTIRTTTTNHHIVQPNNTARTIAHDQNLKQSINQQLLKDDDFFTPNLKRKSIQNATSAPENKVLFDRNFFFDDFKIDWENTDPTAGFRAQDAFSGSWWQSRERFLDYLEVGDKSPSAEGASFEVFALHENYVRVTRDWTDLNVEHMSKWWDVALGNDEVLRDRIGYIDKILEIFQNYVHSKDRSHLCRSLNGDWREVSQSTIAVIAFMPYTRRYGRELTEWSLAATVMSLVQLGVGRIVVSGALPKTEGETYLARAKSEIDRAIKDWNITASAPQQPLLSIDYCVCGNATSDWLGFHDPNIPKAALQRLRGVLLKKPEIDQVIMDCWTGLHSNSSNTTNETTQSQQQNPDASSITDQWKYVFLGEPDLILNTRPSALFQLSQSLRNGGVLAPHRLQPLPHDSDFGLEKWKRMPDRLIPNIPPIFHNVLEIDHYYERNTQNVTANFLDPTLTSCCDGGNDKPYQKLEKCLEDAPWWRCGFESFSNTELPTNKSVVEAAHAIVGHYPLARLKRGTGVVFVGSEIGRICIPSRGGLCIKNKKVS